MIARPTLLWVLVCALLLSFHSSCGGRRLKRSGDVPRSLEVEEVEAAIARAEQALRDGREDLALEWMYIANEVAGLPTEQRNEVRALMERAADIHIHQLKAGEGDPEELAALVEADLPRQIAVTAGIEAARLHLLNGEPKKAYEGIKSMDELYPRHHERAAAGGILSQAGMELSYDEGGFLFFYRVRTTGKEALEYLVLNYPRETRCDEAYWRLGEMYEEDEDWPEAIERLEELVIYHADSPFYPLALARIPRLRLASIESPEYDRKQIIRARKELGDWLENYQGLEIEPEVRDDLDDALRRLAESDLLTSKFYRKVGNPFGHRFHAMRALEEALEAGDEERERRALDLLADLGPNEGWGKEPSQATDDVLPDAKIDEDRLGTGVRE